MAEKGMASIHIEATPDRVFEVIQDIESYPDRIDAFRKAEVLDRDGDGRPLRAAFELDARIKQVEYELEYSYDDDSIAWRSVGGNVKEINGKYTVTPSGGGSEVIYDYSIDPGFPVPGFLVRQGVKMMVSGALDDLKKTAEK